MSSNVSWMLLTFAVQFFAPMLRPKTHGKGRIFTMPMRKALPKLYNHSWCRLAQLITIFAVSLFVSMGIFYWVAVIALYLDDYLTGDDEFLKRWKEARNKIKWKMELPQPVKVDV